MKKIVMLIAVILGTSVMANANVVPAKINASKEVKANLVRKHKHTKKAKVAKSETSKTVSQTPQK